VEAARHRVRLVVELAAGVQDGQHDLERGLAQRRVLVDRDATAVVDDPAAALGQQRDGDLVALPRHRLVDRVVDDLVDEVVEAARPGRTDVHARTLAHRLETLEDGDVLGAVLAASRDNALKL
jgi:hypothetical protein